MSLNNLSIHLATLGRRTPALEAIREAAGLYRQLAEARPDAFLPTLGMALYNLGLRLNDVGVRAQALVAVDEASRIYGRLAERYPAVFGDSLAACVDFRKRLARNSQQA
jgi:hypothetical protein